VDVFECIRKRRSIREFKDEPASDEVVEEILEAARMAPSAQNRQECTFIVIRNKEIKNKVMEAVVETELSTTQVAWKRVQLGGAPLEVMAQTMSKMTGRNITRDNIQSQDDLPKLLEQYTRFGIANMFNADVLIAVYRKALEEMSVTIPSSYDVGAAIQNMLLVATSHDLGSVWAGGFGRRETKVEYRAVGTAVRQFYRDKISEILQVPKDLDLAALVFVGKAAIDPAPPPKKRLHEICFLDSYGNPWKRS
jgi:nitroreductase